MNTITVPWEHSGPLSHNLNGEYQSILKESQESGLVQMLQVVMMDFFSAVLLLPFTSHPPSLWVIPMNRWVEEGTEGNASLLRCQNSVNQTPPPCTFAPPHTNQAIFFLFFNLLCLQYFPFALSFTTDKCCNRVVIWYIVTFHSTIQYCSKNNQCLRGLIVLYWRTRVAHNNSCSSTIQSHVSRPRASLSSSIAFT